MIHRESARTERVKSSGLQSFLDRPIGQFPIDEVFKMDKESLERTIRARSEIAETIPILINTNFSPKWDEDSVLRVVLLRLEGYPVGLVTSELSDDLPGDEEPYGNEDVTRACGNYVNKDITQKFPENAKVAAENMLISAPPGSDIQKWRDGICEILQLQPLQLFPEGKIPAAEVHGKSDSHVPLEKILQVAYHALNDQLPNSALAERFGGTSESITSLFKAFDAKTRKILHEKRGIKMPA